jgi:hypothetical protein
MKHNYIIITSNNRIRDTSNDIGVMVDGNCVGVVPMFSKIHIKRTVCNTHYVEIVK